MSIVHYKGENAEIFQRVMGRGGVIGSIKRPEQQPKEVPGKDNWSDMIDTWGRHRH